MTEDKKPFDLEACRARFEAAARGPWRLNEDEGWIEAPDTDMPDDNEYGAIVLELHPSHLPLDCDSDLRFILQSRDDVEGLLALVDKQAAWMKQAQAHIAELEEHHARLHAAAGLAPVKP